MSLSLQPRQSAELTVLVADDNPADRMILGRLVSRLGHKVISVENGLLAVEQFSAQHPDLVLLDALMPVMDGFDAARRIKELAGEDLVPIIFLTSLSESDALVKCLQAGGDDFLSKPYNPVVLQAKIDAFGRMHEMHNTLRAQRDLITSQHQRLIRDQELAKTVFDRVAHAGCLSASNLRYLQSAFAMFNGDILLAAYKPSGGMHILLGDFTGHGLSAAIGAMPLAEVFYAMSARGFNLRDIIVELNGKLAQILPVGIFCCAVLIEVNPAKGLVEIWNGGLPEVLIIGHQAELLHRIPSTHLPLGVAKAERFNPNPVVLAMQPGDRLLCWTDGVIESRNQQGEPFGEQRVLRLLEDYPGRPQLFFDGLLQAIEAFHGAPQDDISLLELVMQEPVQQRPTRTGTAGQAQSAQDWQLAYTFRAASVRHYNPLPFLLEALMDIPGLRPHIGSIFVILSELYSNALEHGLLSLDSKLKRDSEGFAQYYAQRSQQLSALRDGWIQVVLDHSPTERGGVLRIEVSDSGEGFAPVMTFPNNEYAGRGLALVAALADEIKYNAQGNRARAVFSWVTGP
ncbi:MAG: fused response regulator/phosphatase [Pseudomonas profundi]|uniref:ATP-binding SpoIIE family protein phosphatase n=1 Tax=Pseudomonas profundi TaxID=1981513 RepID=UPI003002E713